MTGLVLLIDENGQNQENWTSIDKLSEVATKAYQLVVDDFEAPEEVAILLTSNQHVQQLNVDFRGKDKPTNVLSFPDDSDARLGDIAIAFETVEVEAKQGDVLFVDHLTHLIVHGILHLLGYDHIVESDAEQMEALEIDLLAKLGIQNPYLGLILDT